MNDEQVALALQDAVRAAHVAFEQASGWCEALIQAGGQVGSQDRAERRGAGHQRTDPAQVQALEVRGRLADAVRKLEWAAEKFAQARDTSPR